jgi:hypothetical protein
MVPKGERYQTSSPATAEPECPAAELEHAVLLWRPEGWVTGEVLLGWHSHQLIAAKVCNLGHIHDPQGSQAASHCGIIVNPCVYCQKKCCDACQVG